MRANYHTHCDFCDGKATVAAMAEAAHRAGYEVLGFSSHAPLPFPTSWNMSEARLADYAAEVRRVAEAWAGRLEILLGLEIDWIEGTRGPRDSLFDPIDLDFRIGSSHYVKLGGGLFTVDEPEAEFALDYLRYASGDMGVIWREYYRCLSAMIERGGFDILAHFDLVRKNNGGGHRFDEEDPAYLAAAFEAAALLEHRDIVAEINVGSMARGKMGSPYPSLAILRELARLGVPITFSADAHSPAHLAAHLGDARALAKAAGYRSVAVLTGGRWIEVGIDGT